MTVSHQFLTFIGENIVYLKRTHYTFTLHCFWKLCEINNKELNLNSFEKYYAIERLFIGPICFLSSWQLNEEYIKFDFKLTVRNFWLLTCNLICLLSKKTFQVKEIHACWILLYLKLKFNITVVHNRNFFFRKTFVIKCHIKFVANNLFGDLHFLILKK